MADPDTSHLPEKYHPQSPLYFADRNSSPAAAPAAAVTSKDPITSTPDDGATRRFITSLPLDPDLGARSWDADGQLSPEVQQRRDYARVALGRASLPTRPRGASPPVTRDQPILIDDSDDEEEERQGGDEDGYSTDTDAASGPGAAVGDVIQIVDSDEESEDAAQQDEPATAATFKSAVVRRESQTQRRGIVVLCCGLLL